MRNYKYITNIYYIYILIYLYITNLRGRIPTVRTPENIDKVKMAIVKIRRCSVGRNSGAIEISDRSVRWILHKDLSFHPYKLALVQELNDGDMPSRKISSEQLLEMLNDDSVICTLLMIDEAPFNMSGYVNKWNYRYVDLKIHKSSISLLSTAKDWLCGVGSRIFEFLALNSLKTRKVQPLLWHPSAMWRCYATSVNQRYAVVGSISPRYGFSKMEQQPTLQGHQWVFSGKCFHNTSFPVAALFHGRHVRLISATVITFYGGISKGEFSCLSQNYTGTKGKHKGRNRGDPEADDRSGDGKFWSKTETVFEKWWETSEWRTLQNLK